MRNALHLHFKLWPRLLGLAIAFVLPGAACPAQQTLGGIAGQVTDASGGAIPGAMATAEEEHTALTRSAIANGAGEYELVNLPIGSYTLSFAANGYTTQRTQHIVVQAGRTATMNAALPIGRADLTIEVAASPMLNAVDTTNGYVLEHARIEQAPLAPAALPGWRFYPPASMQNCPAAPAPTPGWAMRRSGPTDSAIPPTAFC